MNFQDRDDHDDRDDRRAIEDLMVRYATAIDRRDWALFETCFIAECGTDYGPIGRWSDYEGLVGFMAAVHAPMGLSAHRMSNIVPVVDGDSATCRTYVQVVLQVNRDDPPTIVESFGIYDDELTRTDAGWRIARRTFTEIAQRTF